MAFPNVGSVRRPAEIAKVRHPCVGVDMHVNEAGVTIVSLIDRALGSKHLRRATDGDDTTVAYCHVGDSIAIGLPDQ
jgi:hypothetical protein